MTESIHTYRWIEQLKDTGWDIHVFPSTTRAHLDVYPQFKKLPVTFHTIPRITLYKILTRIFRLPLKKPDREQDLARLIDRLAPDIIHSLETQKAGYSVARAKKLCTRPFPLWVHTIWGSDINVFGKDPAHIPHISDVLKGCSFLVLEGTRDIARARELGFTGEAIVLRNVVGGMDLRYYEALMKKQPPSKRKCIALKGYQHWAGRALIGLQALEQCADLLKGYTLMIYAATPDVIEEAMRFQTRTNTPVKILEHMKTSHDDILRMHGSSRISIGLSVSDGLPSSLQETMAMGSFPIQSDTFCHDEWFVDGVNGLLVPPEDPAKVAQAIRRALTDDTLVDTGAGLNAKIIREQFEYSVVQKQVIAFYTMVQKKIH